MIQIPTREEFVRSLPADGPKGKRPKRLANLEKALKSAKARIRVAKFLAREKK